MNSIEYNFTINDTVWVVDDNDVLECVVTQITLEADPAYIDGVENKSTYHIHPITTQFDILLRSPEDLFASLSEIMGYITDGIIPPPPPPTTIYYEFAVNQDVWTVVDDTPIPCTVIQITFDIDPDDDLNDSIRIIYHVLPPPDTYSTLLRYELEVFETEQDAIDYILDKKQSTTSPTPTPTNAPTPTPTPTPSVATNVILAENYDWLLDEDGFPILEE